MIDYKKIIFLDEENTRLSPITEEMLRLKLREKGLQSPEVCSRGNVVLFPEPVNQKIVQVAKNKGLDLSEYSAKQLDETDLGADVLVLALDSQSRTKVFENFTSAGSVYLFKEYLGSTGDLKLPIGGTVDDYTVIVDMIGGLLDVLIEKITDNKEQDEG